MINGNYTEFLDNLDYGEEMYLKYKGRIYFVEGWHESEEPNKYFMCCFIVKGPANDEKDGYLWKTYRTLCTNVLGNFSNNQSSKERNFPK